MTRWKISPVPTQRQVKEIRKVPNVHKVERDGKYSIVHHTAHGWTKQHMLVHTLGDLGFEVLSDGWGNPDPMRSFNARRKAEKRLEKFSRKLKERKSDGK